MVEEESIDLLRKLDFDFMTDNDYKLYNLKWIIRKFFKLPFYEEIDSPPFRPAPGCEMRLYFKKFESQIFIRLGNELENEFEARVSLVVKSTTGNPLYQSKNTYKFLQNEKKNILGSVKFIYHQLEKLKNETLVIVCSISVIKKFTTKQLFPENKDPNDPPKKYDGVMKLAEDLRTLCTDKRHVDVTFKLNDKIISANMAILVARSPRFDRIVRKHRNDQKNCRIELDVTSTVFEKFLDFLHTGEFNVDIDCQSASALYCVANTFEVFDLRKMCADTLVTSKRAIRTLFIADRFKDDDLKERALSSLCEQMDQYAKSEIFEQFVSSKSKLAAEVIMHFTKTMWGVEGTENESVADAK